MARKQASVSTVGRMADVLQEIYETFPDLEPGNDGQAYQRALIDWFQNRDKNSKSAKLASIKEDTVAIVDVTKSTEQKLDELRGALLYKLEEIEELVRKQ